MDVFRFINSNAVRNHLKEIGYKFSGFEAAWLVWNCRTATIKERHAAWNEIIETYPDEEYKGRQIYFSKSVYLHSMLNEYMEQQRRTIDFVSEEPVPGSFIYRYRLISKEGIVVCDYDFFFPTLESVLSDIRQDISKYDGFALVEKCSADGEPNFARIIVNSSGEIIRAISDFIDLDEEDHAVSCCFLNMDLIFPVPYHIGDILYDPGISNHDAVRGFVFLSTQEKPLSSTPFVFTGCGINETVPYDDRSYPCGFFQFNDGAICKHFATDHTSLEFYPEEELKGVRRTLKALSSLVRGDIDEVNFANVFAYILADERTKQLDPCRYLTKDEIWLAGLE